MFQYTDHGLSCIAPLDGQFAFILYDSKNDKVIAARDRFGVASLFVGVSRLSPSALYFASEAKALTTVCDQVEPISPGAIYDSQKRMCIHLEKAPAMSPQPNVAPMKLLIESLLQALRKSVRKRLDSGDAIGLLLSNDLPSALLAFLIKDELSEQRGREDWAAASSFSTHGEGTKISAKIPETCKTSCFQTVSVHYESSPTGKNEWLSDQLGMRHHTCTITEKEGLDSVPEVVYYLETCDQESVQAAVPLFWLGRRLRSLGLRTALSGDGAASILSKAGRWLEVRKERKSEEGIEKPLTAARAFAAWGIETRCPFLDTDVLAAASLLSQLHEVGSSKLSGTNMLWLLFKRVACSPARKQLYKATIKLIE